ncbi:hypothetical protein AcV7_010213 [Taiwanofungus camphoratus]|nr:hypothetical protein AcV7_010213 [Antrodia cinnamomea]
MSLDLTKYENSVKPDLGFVKLDGSTKQSDRMPLIDKFHEDPDIFVFLISTLAGGTGLNLTGANKVVIFDPNWNPAHDLQAMDRAYRFGQLRDVSVYRLLGAGSIEELVYARQVYKQQQMLVGYNASFQTRYFEGVQGEKGKQGELFGIKNIFKLHEDTLATKMAIERAVLTDLDWALAHVDAKAKRASSGAPPPEVIEAKINKDVGDLRGLEALLFDDSEDHVSNRTGFWFSNSSYVYEDVPKIDSKANDLRKTLQKTLNDIGVNYTHRNEFLIAESTIEGRRVQTMLEEKKKVVRRTRKAKAQGMDSSQIKRASPEPEWPPKRRHHKAPPSPMARWVVFAKRNSRSS